MKVLFKVWFSLVLLLIIGFLIWFPSEKEIKSCMTTSMYQVNLCPKSKDYVPLSQISRNIQNAVILTEDAGFYHHNGFDEEGIQHCFKMLKEKRRIVCGGSTITQQLAKNMFLSKNKNFLRKGVEALITFKLEYTLTKREILEKYLNIVQFGKNIFGIKQASQFYFKKHPSQLNATEAAFLAMVLPNPEKYSQSYFRKDLTNFARKRISRIVSNMHRFGRLDTTSFSGSISNLDSFLKQNSTVKPVQEHEETLSQEDLDEMDDTIDFEASDEALKVPPPTEDEVAPANE